MALNYGDDDHSNSNGLAMEPHRPFPPPPNDGRSSNYNFSSDQSDPSDREEQPRYLSDLARGRAANFYVNGEVFFPSRKIVYNPKHFKDFPHYMDFLTDKLGPRFGAVRKICTPLHGHRIRSVRDMQENGVYVVAGKERFKPYQYDQITPTDRRRLPPYNYNADPVYHNRQYVTSGKIRKCETQSLLIKVWPNGGDLKGPRRVLLTPRVRPFTLPNVLSQVNEILKEDCSGTVEKLYFLNGVKVSDVDQITQNGQYVACRRTERFKRARYNEQATKNLSTSPRLERKFLAPLLPRVNNYSNHSSPEHSNTSTQNSVNSYTQRKRWPPRDEDNQLLPVKPLKRTSSPEKFPTVDLDRDPGGVFKAKNYNRSTRGAREVEETRYNRTEWSGDQREARKNEDETLKGKDLKKDYQQRNGYAGRGRIEQKSYNSKKVTPPPDKKDDIYAQQQEKSALPIQASYHGYRSHKELSTKAQQHGEANSHDRRRNSLYQELDKEDKAAALIQAIYRGHMTRKQLSKKQNNDAADNQKEKAVSKFQANYPNHKVERQLSNLSEKEKAAAKIQAIYRGYQAQKQLKTQSDLSGKETAAAKIQAAYRGRQVRKQLKAQSGVSEKEKAAAKIQAAYRGRQARKQLKTQSDVSEKGKAAAKIQAAYRGRQARKQLKEQSDVSEKEKAAAKIQAAYRGHQAQKQLKEQSDVSEKEKAAAKIQAAYRSNQARKQLKSMLEKEKAVTKIQASFRGYQARQQLKEAPSRMTSQSGTHQSKQDTPDSVRWNEEMKAAEKIQASYRGHISRKQTNSMKIGKNQKCSQTPENTYDELDKESEAAMKIQSHYRGYKARKEFESRGAATFSDKYWP